MLKSAFISQKVERFKDVYSKENIEKIKGKTNLITDEIVNSKEMAFELLKDVEVIFSTWGMLQFTDEELDNFPNLKIVCYAAGATDNFCRPFLRRNIKIVSAWQANAIPVAEYTVSAIILGLKNFFQLSRKCKDEGYFLMKNAGRGSYGAKIALLGNGSIAQHTLKLLQNFHFETLVIPSRIANRTTSFEEAFSTCQVISNHLPDRDDNVNCISEELLSSMPRNAILINTGRGRQLDHQGLAKVLKKRPDITAILDVTYPEPLEKTSPLFDLQNVFLTPHIAGSLNDEYYRMVDYVLDDLDKFENGEEIQNLVSESMLISSQTKGV